MVEERLYMFAQHSNHCAKRETAINQAEEVHQVNRNHRS